MSNRSFGNCPTEVPSKTGRSLHLSSVLLLAEMFLDQSQHHRCQQEHADQVGHGHKAIEGVADAPDQAQIRGGTQNGHQTVGDVEGQKDLASQQEFSAAGTVQTPAHNGGEGEAAHGHGGEDGDPVAVNAGKAADGQFSAGGLTVGNLHAAEQDHQRSQGADDDGVHKHFEDAIQALLGGIVGIGAGVGDGAGTQTSLIGEDAAGHALLQADEDAAHHTAGKGRRVEGTLEDGSEHGGHPVNAKRDQADAQQDVQNRHHRHQLFGNPADALQAADKDQRHDDADDDADDQVGGGESICAEHVIVDQRGIDGSGDGVDLRGVAGAEHGAYAKESVQIRQPHPVFAQTVFNVVHGAAHVVAVLVALTEVHRQRYFGKLGAHAQNGGDPHPEHSTGAADGDGTCHTGDVARAHRGGQCRADRLERRQRAFCGFFFLEQFAQRILHGIAELAQGQEAGADGQIQAHAKDAHHGGHAPDKVVENLIDICDDIYHVFLRCNMVFPIV